MHLDFQFGLEASFLDESVKEFSHDFCEYFYGFIVSISITDIFVIYFDVACEIWVQLLSFMIYFAG